MRTFGKLKLENYVLFDEAEFDFGRRGITTIRGLNKNATSKRSTGDVDPSNASGKSLLASTIPNLLYGSEPTVIIGKSMVQKDAFYRKGARLSIDITKDNHHVHVSKFLKGQSLRYDIVEDGKSLDANTKTAGEQWLSEFINLSEEVFYSTAYLDSRRPIPLLTGTPASRFDFFNKLFRLDTFDVAQQIFKSAKAELEEQKVKYDLKVKELADLKHELADLVASIGDKTEQSVVKAQEYVEKQQKRVFKLEQAQRRIARLADLDSGAKYDPKQHKKLSKQLLIVKRELDDLNNLLAYLTKLEKFTDKNKIALKRAKSACKAAGVSLQDNVGKMVAKLESAIEKITESQSDYDDYIAEKKRLEKLLPKTPYTKKDCKQLEKRSNVIKKKLYALKQKLREYNLDELEGGKCPTCGSVVDIEHLKGEVKRISKEIATLNTQFKDVAKQHAAATEYLSVKKRIDSLKPVEKPDTNSLKSNKAKLELLEQAEASIENLNRLEKPKRPRSVFDTESVSDIEDFSNSRLATIKDLEASIEKMELKRRASSLLSELKDLGFASVKEVEVEAKQLKGVNLSKEAQEINTLLTKFGRRKQIESVIAKTEELVEKYAERLKKNRILDALVSAYGNAGLKRYVAGDIADIVCRNINEMSSLVFAENYKFHFEVTETKFGIFYEAKHGIFDVRKLSGAESRSFTALLMLGILPILHSDTRTNLLVLDELDAHMDPVTLDRFTNGLIPALSEEIPHIVIVTNKDEVYSDALSVRVVKDGTTSTLVYE